MRNHILLFIFLYSFATIIFCKLLSQKYSLIFIMKVMNLLFLFLLFQSINNFSRYTIYSLLLILYNITNIDQNLRNICSNIDIFTQQTMN